MGPFYKLFKGIKSMSFSARHRCQCVSKALQGHLGAVAAPPALIKALQCRKERGDTLLSEYGNDHRHPLLLPRQPLQMYRAGAIEMSMSRFCLCVCVRALKERVSAFLVKIWHTREVVCELQRKGEKCGGERVRWHDGPSGVVATGLGILVLIN